MYNQNGHPKVLPKTLLQIQPKAYEGHVQADKTLMVKIIH